MASRDAAEGSLLIHQDARIFLASIDADQHVTQELSRDRHAWLQVLRGTVSLNGVDLQTGDGAAVSDESILKVLATCHAEVMLFDLA